jgi:uncharacterized membrane protein YcaP (DUF421 family)
MMLPWLFRNLVTMGLLVLMARWVAGPRLGKLGLIDLLMVNAIGDLASHTVFDEHHPFLPGVGSIAFWIIVAAFTGYLTRRYPAFRRFYYGQPHELVRDGQVDLQSMRKAGVGLADLESELRKQGVKRLDEAKNVTLEPDGSIAISNASETAQELKRLAAALTSLAAQVGALAGKSTDPNT